MIHWRAFWSILQKDMKTYYLKPPNISWGIIFPVAWALMFFIRSPSPPDIKEILPGIMSMSVLFGTTSMLAVTITFERRSNSFDRLLLSPISLPLLMGAKTSGAILFGFLNAFVPLIFSTYWISLSRISWNLLLPGILFVSVTSAFFGLVIAVSVSEVFEAQTFSNFLRFPMIFLCGLFVSIDQIPWFIRPVSYLLPLTYGNDMLKHAVTHTGTFPNALNFFVLAGFTLFLFSFSLHNVRKRWIR